MGIGGKMKNYEPLPPWEQFWEEEEMHFMSTVATSILLLTSCGLPGLRLLEKEEKEKASKMIVRKKNKKVGKKEITGSKTELSGGMTLE